jgi:hypothetical protein
MSLLPAENGGTSQQVAPELVEANENAATLDGDWTKQDRPQDGEFFYCPACGKRVTYQQKCIGSNRAAPHPATEVVDAVEIWDSRYPEDARDPMTGRQYPIGALDPNLLTAGPVVDPS